MSKKIGGTELLVDGTNLITVSRKNRSITRSLHFDGLRSRI